MAMKVKYDAEDDIVYLRLTDHASTESDELKPGVVVDLDSDGKIVAIEFLNAKERFAAETIRELGEAA